MDAQQNQDNWVWQFLISYLLGASDDFQVNDYTLGSLGKDLQISENGSEKGIQKNTLYPCQDATDPRAAWIKHMALSQWYVGWRVGQV